MRSRPGAEIREAGDGVIVDGLERVEEADRLVLGERDGSLVGEDVGCPVGCGSAEEVAQRLADGGCRRLVDGPLFVGESAMIPAPPGVGADRPLRRALAGEKQFARSSATTQLPRLAVAVARGLHLQQPHHSPAQEAGIAVTM